MTKIDTGFANFGEIMANKKSAKIKPAPAYQWQELALKIIQELSIPGFKRNSVFKVCKNNPQQVVLRAFNDTKELCKSGEKWKYFFKIVKS